MGDGRCALILDIDGLAAHAGLDFALASSGAKASDAVKSSSAKLARRPRPSAFQERPRGAVRTASSAHQRIERIKLSDVQRAGEREVHGHRRRPDPHPPHRPRFKVSPCVEREDMYLLMPKHCAKPSAFLVSSLVDIANSPLDLNTDSVAEDGILGSALLKGKMTLYPDIYRMVELLEPEWLPRR
jgi:two-component system chemotaxis sensor kinase CheA